MRIRIVAAVFAAGLFAADTNADEHAGYHHLEAAAGALQPCRTAMVLALPPSWQAGDGAAVLMTLGHSASVSRDVLVSTLLAEQAAVLELAPVHCEGAPAMQNSVVAGAVDALQALTRTMGAGMTVALGYGPGARAILEVVGAPNAGRAPDADHPRFGAAIALGDGAPAFARGGPLAEGQQAPGRLRALCRALAPLFDRVGALLHASAPHPASEACLTTIAGAVPTSDQARGEAAVAPDAERSAFQVASAAGTLEMPPGSAGRRLPLVMVLHDHLGMDGRSDAYAAQLLGAGIAVLDLAVADAGGIGAALAALGRDPRVDITRLGVMGFGAGARLAATLPFSFAAYALLYPGCADLGGLRTRGADVLLMHGGADPSNTVEACAHAVQRFETAGLRVQQRTFARATYAWDYPPHGVEAPSLLPAAGAEARVQVRPWPALVALSSTELAGFFAGTLNTEFGMEMRDSLISR